MDVLENMTPQEKQAIKVLSGSGFTVLTMAKLEAVLEDQNGVKRPTFKHAGLYEIAIVKRSVVAPQVEAQVEAQVEIDPVSKEIVVPNDHAKRSKKKTGGEK